MNLNNLVKRTAAGIIYVAIILFALLGGEIAFLAIFGLFLSVALYEFFRMADNDSCRTACKIFQIVSGLVIYLSFYLLLKKISLIAFPYAIAAYVLMLFLSTIFINRKDIIQTTAYSLFGHIYITLPLSILLFVSQRYGDIISIGNYKNLFMLAIFVLIWINDTGAFLFGSLFGKHRLIERISPKKSVEGFISGIVISVIAAIVFSLYFHSISIYLWVAIGFITSIFASLGDLFESLLKRTFGVKDSGNIIPGHGGILDRIDSLLIVFPAIFLLLLFCTRFGLF